MALKIKTTKVNGETCVPPEVMDLLLRLGNHREFCDACSLYCAKGIGNYCHIGRDIILELEKQPSVEFIPEPRND